MFIQIYLWLFIVFAAFFVYTRVFFFIFQLFDLMCLTNEVSCSQLKLSKFVWMLSNSLDVINFVKYFIAHIQTHCGTIVRGIEYKMGIK